MSKLKHGPRSHGSFGTALLAGACCAGAVAYTAIVGPTMLPPQQPEQAVASPELGTVSGSSSLEEPGPVGRLEVRVSDRERAYIQNLRCTGDLEEDPAACAFLAQAAAGGGDVEDVFAEVSPGTVCTDKVYGPQEAVITGEWEGEEVETELSRRGSCEEARWQRLRPVTEPLG